MACETEGQDIPKYRANSFQNTFLTACASSQTTTGQIFTSPHIELVENFGIPLAEVARQVRVSTSAKRRAPAVQGAALLVL
ncbi:MAG: hypothetical protein K8R75_02895 [Deltaproteobacteria bacterium]|nr:hypothetical protein [Deltaproteobacteria bacterium]